MLSIAGIILHDILVLRKIASNMSILIMIMSC